MEQYIYSRKANAKRYVRKNHEADQCIPTPTGPYDVLDAYFGPDGQFNLQIKIDDRIFTILLDEKHSRRLAQRLCKDTLDRALNLLASKEEAA